MTGIEELPGQTRRTCTFARRAAGAIFQFRTALLAALVCFLWICWQYAQNGRYQFRHENYASMHIVKIADTRIGTVSFLIFHKDGSPTWTIANPNDGTVVYVDAVERRVPDVFGQVAEQAVEEHRVPAEPPASLPAPGSFGEFLKGQAAQEARKP